MHGIISKHLRRNVQTKSLGHQTCLRLLLTCYAGFTFPNCLGNLTLTVSGAGQPPPTGNITLIVAGGHKNATLGSVRPSGLQWVLLHAAHVSCHSTPAESMSTLIESH